MMTPEEYEKYVADIRSAPGWKPKGEWMCGDCCTMTHCETHQKDEGEYPEEPPK